MYANDNCGGNAVMALTSPITPFSLKNGTGESKAFFPESLQALHSKKSSNCTLGT